MASATAGKAAAKPKKAAAAKKPRAHPPYVEMISEAIAALKERTGSSQVAIAKFIEEKQKELPPNFRKLLLVQLKKLVASGKLTKVKNSFKLAGTAKTAVAAAAKPKAAAEPKKKTAAAAKPKAAAAKKVLVEKPKKKVSTPSKAKKTTAAKAKPAKRTPVKKVALSKVKSPVKKPKSIKSPAKKARK
nr:histone H1-like [Ipomoea trifida]